MLIKFTNSYNPKIDLKIIFGVNSVRPRGATYVDIRKVFYKGKTPVTNEQKSFFVRWNIYKTLKDNELNFKTITKALDGLEIAYNKNQLYRFTNDLNQISNIDSQIVFVLKRILINKIFVDCSFALASFICNSLLYKHGCYPVIFTFNDLIEIQRDIFLLNLSNEQIIEKIIKLQESSVFYSKKNKPITKEEIVAIILNNKSYLLNNHIYSVYLYGSFYRGDYSEYSDIDLIIDAHDEILNKDDISKIIQPLLSRRLDVHIKKENNIDDIIEFSEKIY